MPSPALQRPASNNWTVYGVPAAASASRQLATSAITIRGIKVTGGGGGTTVRIRDSNNGSAESGPGPQSYTVAANAGETNTMNIQHEFIQGLYIAIEQNGDGNGDATVFYD